MLAKIKVFNYYFSHSTYRLAKDSSIKNNEFSYKTNNRLTYFQFKLFNYYLCKKKILF